MSYVGQRTFRNLTSGGAGYYGGSAPAYGAPPGGIAPAPVTNGRYGSPAAHVGVPAAPVAVKETPRLSDVTRSFRSLTVEEQFRTIFIAKLPPGIADEAVVEALGQISGLVGWRRVALATGKPSRMGFALYETLESVKVALEVLGKLEIPEKLQATAEKGTWDQLMGPALASATIECVTNMSREALVARMAAVFIKGIEAAKHTDEKADDKSNDKPEELSEQAMSDMISASLSGENTIAQYFPDVDTEFTMEEIREFRKQSLKFEKAKQAADEEYEKETQRRMELNAQRALETDARAKPSQAQLDWEAYHFSEDEDEAAEDRDGEGEEEMDDEQAERLRQERKLEELDAAFSRALRRWLHRERVRTEALEKDLRREEERVHAMARAKESDLKKFAELDDTSESVRRTMLFYKDRSAWFSKRMNTSEVREDTQDREEEAHEKAREEAKHDPKAAAAYNPDASLTIPVVHISAIGLSQNKPPQVELPKDDAAVLAWSVKWDKLDSGTVDEKLKPFARSKIVDYLGMEEEDLLQFIIAHVREHKPPGDLIKELEMTLDEDAAPFVTELWRLIIESTERVYN